MITLSGASGKIFDQLLQCVTAARIIPGLRNRPVVMLPLVFDALFHVGEDTDAPRGYASPGPRRVPLAEEIRFRLEPDGNDEPLEARPREHPGIRHGAADVFQACESIAAILAANSAVRQVLLHLMVQFLQVHHRTVLQLRHYYDPRHSILLSIFSSPDRQGLFASR